MKIYNQDSLNSGRLSIKRKLSAGSGSIRKMLRSSDNIGNVIRPRKTTNGESLWTSSTTNGHLNGSVFRIGEMRTADFAIALPASENHLVNQTSDDKYHKRKDKTKTNMCRRILTHVESYCEKSTLHGLRYVGDTSLSIGERLFWFISFALAIAFATYYITNIFQKWNNSPVLIAFNPFDASIDDLPFPSITICNMNQAKKYEALKIQSEGTKSEKTLLNDYCNTNDSANNDDAADWNTVQNFLVRVGESCTDSLKSCFWENDKINCEEYFNNVFTDEGLCCSFNRLPLTNLFRNPNDIAVLNQTYPLSVYDWSPETGYGGIDKARSQNVIPLRAAGAGVHLGLTIVLDAHADHYFCSSTQSIGFKVFLSNPIETPKITDFAFILSPGLEIRYRISPDIREASPTLRNLPIESRQCFFQNERPLRYFRKYTKRNCELECQSNHTLRMCDCIPYYLPKSKSTGICGKKKEFCSERAKEDMEKMAGNGSSCHCLASCYEVNYDKSSTFSNLYTLSPKYGVDNISLEYIKENIDVLHFFFRDSKFRKQIKSEIYGFTEALSNIGGLLGLFMGFSFLSLVELIYFTVLKTLCNYVKNHVKHRKKKIVTNDNFKHTIPFMK